MRGPVRKRTGAVVAAAIALSAAPSCTSNKGALILAMSTDMQTPKDISVVSVYITTNGAPKFDYIGRVRPDGSVDLPSTLAIVEPDQQGAEVRIRVIAFQEQKARVLRDVLTTVPHQRTALLRMPLSFLDDGSVTGTLPSVYLPAGPDDPNGAPEGDTLFQPDDPDPTAADYMNARCDFTKGLTSVDGVCQSAVVDSSSLPDYADAEVFGDGGSVGAPACFDVASCFARTAKVNGVATTGTACSFALPPGTTAATLDVALATPSTGVPVGGLDLVPLDDDPAAGFAVAGQTVSLARGVCAALQTPGVELVVATGCSSKVAATPVCQPYQQAAADSGAGLADATVGVDAPTDAPAQADAGTDAQSGTDAGGKSLRWVAVADQGNDRLLLFQPPLTPGMSASFVIGQPDFTSLTSGVGASSVAGLYGCAFDPSGNLWVADGGNHRVLEFVAPFQNGMAASLVLGQLNFTANTSNEGGAVSAKSLNLPYAPTFDGSGNLWVADTQNNRVLGFTPPFATNMAASFVLGQSSFSAAAGAVSAAQLNDPTSLAFDPSGGLWVVDYLNTRVVGFAPPFLNGTSATSVLGQADFTSRVMTGPTQSLFASPQGVAADLAGNILVSDTDRVLRFTPPFAAGAANASGLLGQSSYTSDVANLDGGAAGPSTLYVNVGIKVEPTSGEVYVTDTGNNRVLVFPSSFVNGMGANNVLGQPDFVTTARKTGQNGFAVPYDVCFDAR